MILSALLLGALLAFFVLFYRSSECYMQINTYTKSPPVPIHTSKIKAVDETTVLSTASMVTEGFSFDPMQLVDTSVDVYKVKRAIRIMDKPEEDTYYYSLDAGEWVMNRGKLANGWYHVQMANGRMGYIKGLLDLEFIGHEPCGITRHKYMPPDATVYIVGEGDRVLRYQKSSELKNNAAGIINVGTRVYALTNNHQFFRIILEDGRTGYINSQCLEPVIPEGYEEELPIVDGGRTVYDYQEMMDDIVLLLAEYPQYLKLIDVGESELGRSIPALLLGKEDAPHKVLVQAGIHGREYATTQILMKQLEVMLYHCDIPNDAGYTYGSILDKVAYYIIPMSNPDGCMISILGEMSVADYDDREKLLAIRDANVDKEDEETYNSYFKLWKANFNGVDLNRNFDANWKKVEDSVQEPANVNYKGSAPFDQKESQFLKPYVERDDVALTVSYHTSGAMIFWWYHQEGPLEEQNYDLAKLVHRCSGYPIMGRQESYGSHGGMKDYGIVLGKPSITIEMGYYTTPIPPTDKIEVMEKTSRLLPRLGSWLISQIKYGKVQN